MPRLSRILAAFSLALSWAAAALADECPSRTAVERAVGELAAREGGGPVFDDRARQNLELADLGVSFRVTLSGRAREYSDPARDCERRARLAAVFIALVLTGEDSPEARPAAPSTETPKAPAPRGNAAARNPPPPPPSKPARRSGTIVDAAARIAFAPVEGAPVVLPGAELGASFLPGTVRLRVSAAAPLVRGTLAVGPASARLARYPLTVSARWRLVVDSFAVALDGGAEAALLTLARSDGSHATRRVDVAGRLGASLSLAGLTISPDLGAFVEFVPVRFPLALQPDGPITRTPALWVGATAGVDFGF